MPVFDFNNTSEQTEMVQSECTYTVFYSDETEATPEKPMLVLDNKERQWKHHSCGYFTNPGKRTAFEFKEDGGCFLRRYSEDRCTICKPFKMAGRKSY